MDDRSFGAKLGMEVAFASASLFSSSSTVDFISLNAAVNNAVSPSLSCSGHVCVFIQKQPHNRILSFHRRAVESCPAIHIGYLTFAPHSSNNRTVNSCPFCAAL